MRKSAVVPAITNRIWRDLIHNPLHLILSVDVLGMTRSTLASLSKGFAELSTDGQFLRLRSKQVLQLFFFIVELLIIIWTYLIQVETASGKV